MDIQIEVTTEIKWKRHHLYGCKQYCIPYSESTGLHVIFNSNGSGNQSGDFIIDDVRRTADIGIRGRTIRSIIWNNYCILEEQCKVA